MLNHNVNLKFWTKSSLKPGLKPPDQPRDRPVPHHRHADPGVHLKVAPFGPTSIPASPG